VADLPLVVDKLRDRGYEERDVANVMGGNWLNVLRRTLTHPA
jgi:microsomal dipeptidase-like Zn-dependent dipeptidase